ncbi:kinesin-like protein KIF28P [Dasypus novemcinctus]|uniref:kinesin-like protein KIF28P n=1 Tax=Dasypus novemcinctus TaxID=9361 RepID=UPI00265F021D|nr:kinesin-like protein KIF28P [Dasypus novemcinctus]
MPLPQTSPKANAGPGSIQFTGKREKNSGSKCVISMHSNTTTTVQDPRNPQHVKTFTFDRAYWSHSGFQQDKDGVLIPADHSRKFAGQRDVFHDLGKGVLDSALQGYNATLLAYGQTGSGKSYSMLGFGANKGIIPNVCEALFQEIKNRGKNQEYQVTFSMLEIYNEQVRDLLSRARTPGGLKVREDQQRGFYVDGLQAVPCESYAQVERLLAQGTRARTTAATSANARSSRSHVVVTVRLQQVFLDRDLTKQSSINLVDLAGSERQKSSGSEGDRLKEGSRVNLSLTNLGNVISALADAAMGKKVLHIPYRDSVLTKLLQSALGGNSRTALIVAISPADICYEETLSTLRYAERAKKIRTRAVVNSWVPERARRAEDTPLLGRGSSRTAGSASCSRAPSRAAPSRAEPPPPLPAPPAAGLHTVLSRPATWAQQLARAREGWERQCEALAQVSRGTLAQEQRMVETLPHLVNVNQDPQLSGVLKYFIQAGARSPCALGAPPPCPGAPPPSCPFRISDRHATFTNVDGQVTVTPHGDCQVVVNGVPVATTTKLQHLDRLLLGASSAFVYVGFPAERRGEDPSPCDYDAFQLERAAAAGVSAASLGGAAGGDGRADPSVLAAFQDYVGLMPLVAEANQISQELGKGLKMELKVKNLASADSRGCDLQKEVMVKVTQETTRQVWIWSKAKFINRKFLMEELYQRFLDGEDGPMAQEDDPFWDPVEAVPLGSALVWLQPLAYGMECEELADVLNCDGLAEAVLHVHVTPCSATGHARGEEDVVTDPLELLGKRIDFQIHVARCLGTRWLKEDARRGVQIGYRVYDLPSTLYTKAVWKSVNAQIGETVGFAALGASQEFLRYLQSDALVLDLWGLQEGCAELRCCRPGLPVTGEGHVLVDTRETPAGMDTAQTTANQDPELYVKLLELERETELLRSSNRALREENALLRGSLGKARPGGQAHQPSGTLRMAGMMAQPPPACRPRPRPLSHDGEFARALKAFYHSMRAARGQLLRLQHCEPPEDNQMLRPFVHQQSQMLKDFGDLLDSSLWKLKNDVALIVKKKREGLLHIK